MNIVVDIGHPAHVHLFKNFIKVMTTGGHQILITATDKDVTIELLRNYGFTYIAMGSYGNSRIRKMMNISVMDGKMYAAVKSFQPDIFLGASAIRAAHTAWVMRKPCIIFDDTEHSKWEHRLYRPFGSVICTPACFEKDLGKKQVRYNGYHELAYLHPEYFKPDSMVLDNLGLKQDERFVVVRFVAWEAAHDAGQSGFDITAKRRLAHELKKYARVFITSENRLPEEFEEYRISLPPEKIHDLLYYATLYVGEGATMASECAVLGTPAIYVNTLRLGYLDEQEERYGLVFNFLNPASAQETAIAKAIELLEKDNLKEEWHIKKDRLLQEKVDVTSFMVELVENRHLNQTSL